MQLIDLCFIRSPQIAAPFRKSRSHIVNCRTFSRPDLGWVYAILLRQLRHRHFLTDRFKRNLSLEIGRMVLSFRHIESSFS